jgi:amidase/6-aminohexanoate-cyclic-dimer hydrolase
MSIFPEYSKYDAIDLAELVRNKQVSSNELIEEAIRLTEALNPTLNAVVTNSYEYARKEIKSGLPNGPFTGVPFLLKEFELFSGFPLTHSCKYFEDNIADHDSEVVKHYKKGGLVIFGKTNTPEFSLSINTEPQLFGSTHNPWNLNHTVGGSSGGTAAAVAAGIVPVAQASDGGGSIRVPASCCGLFGLKPTRGRNPWGPDYGESWSGMHGTHVISRTVRDSAAMLDLTQGPDIGAPYSPMPPNKSYLSETKEQPKKLRVAFSADTVDGETPVDLECISAMNEAVKLMTELGHEVEEAKPIITPDDLYLTWLITAANTILEVNKYAAKTNREIKEEYFENYTWALMEWCKTMSASDYLKWTQILHRVGREFNQLFEKYDLFITPMLAKPPLKLGELDMMETNIETFMIKFGEFNPFAFTGNYSGNPAMSLPLHWTSDSLPVGVQFIGRYGDEATLFQVAAQLENARPWVDKIPEIHASTV